MASTAFRRPPFDLIKDQYTREGFQYLYDYLQAQPLLQGEFQHFELTFDNAVTNEKVTHSLGFSPSDIIITSSIGAGAVTFNYDEFTETTLDITTSGAVVVRFFGGRYEQ